MAESSAPPPQEEIVLRALDIEKSFSGRSGRKPVLALRGVSINVRRGEAVGLVGESGSGKSTLGRCLVGLLDPTRGSIQVEGRDLATLSWRQMRTLRAKVQIVFQDPKGSLNPRWSVRKTIADRLRHFQTLEADQETERMLKLLEQVGLDASFLDRFPHEMSGGQLQRVGIARALATDPSIIVLDEPTSALDWQSRFEILRLLARLRSELGCSYVFISHDLGAVREICDRVSVMYLGTVVEDGTTGDIMEQPQHPYTVSLLSSVLQMTPGARRDRRKLGLANQSQHAPINGCVLESRCPIAVKECGSTPQELLPLPDGKPSTRLACNRITSGVVEPGFWNKPLDSGRSHVTEHAHVEGHQSGAPPMTGRAVLEYDEGDHRHE